MQSYTEKTLKLLRELGYHSQVVEKWNSFAKIRIDLFGCIDIIAVKPNIIVGVQSTSYGCRRDHYLKIIAEPRALEWIKSGASLWMITWRKRKVKRGGKAIRYEPVIDIFSEDDFKGSVGPVQHSEE